MEGKDGGGMKKHLKDWGYPAEGILDVDAGGGDSYEMPQEALSEHICCYCRNFDSKEYVCKLTGEIMDSDEYCDRIDYIEKWLDSEYGFRTPVRQEYSSDKIFKQACDAIDAINRSIEAENEHKYNVRMYGEYYWRDEDY